MFDFSVHLDAALANRNVFLDMPAAPETAPNEDSHANDAPTKGFWARLIRRAFPDISGFSSEVWPV